MGRVKKIVHGVMVRRKIKRWKKKIGHRTGGIEIVQGKRERERGYIGDGEKKSRKRDISGRKSKV